ncbi:MAG: glycosyltransferase family 4 protein [Bacteroides sp.]|nr:glycosyltransferase family 4 protein [Bacteroides sp.]
MKILILANSDIGLYKFRKELIYELLKNNEVIISLPYGEMVEPLKKAGCIYKETCVTRRGINPFIDIRLCTRYKKIMKEFNPDLVITYTIKPNIYGGYVARIMKKDYAVNITGLGTAFQKKGWLKHLVIKMYKVALKRAKVVFFENQENLNVFNTLNIITHDKCCLLNGAGVNLQYYSMYEYPVSDITEFIFIGRIMQEKGINELFQAMETLYEEGFNVKLNIVGDFEEDYRYIIDQYSKVGWLIYHGYQEDVRPFIEKSHCLVLPSWHEGMANTNLECAACGRPIITSNIPGCREAVINGLSGFLCESKNADSLHNSMKRFINLTYEQKKKMGEAGRKHMEMNFDKNNVVKNTILRLG